ncbi:MAG TPA: cytochrome c biogenesis protein ResB, partial [Ktedonobacteraceae bacterium]|nr:cytochrome c biogenesis protein ResB [Ktedonobacteraceae bacterium]
MATRTNKRNGGTRLIASSGTRTRSPIKTPPGRHPSKNNTPGQRFRQRMAYRLRHPVDAAWGWLSSVRTAILLIAAIIVICLLGIYFVQAPGEVLNDPASYASWIQQNALPRYGSLTPLFDTLQFFTIFSSWYFLLLLTILSVSIVVCTLNRAPAIWQNFKHPVIRRSEKFYQNALERASCSHPDALAFVTAELRKRRYRVRSSVSDDDQPVTYLYANKNSWATLATFVFHAALVTLLMAGVVSQWHGFPQNSPARHILPAPIVALSDSLAGFTFDQALPTGQSAVVYPRGTAHNVSFRVNNFTATFDPRSGLATDYVTDLSVFRDGQLVAHSNHLRVNDPLSYDGIVFHQSSLIPSVTLTISDANGCLVCAQSIVLDQTGNDQGLQVDYAKGVPIAGTPMTLTVAFSHSPAVQLAQVRHPSFLISIGVPGAAPTDLKALANIGVGQTTGSFDKQWNITLNNAAESTVLLVTKDSGSPLIWPTAVMLILSLCLAFYFPQRRIWLRVSGQHIDMAALHEHFTNIRTDLLGITRATQPFTPPSV